MDINEIIKERQEWLKWKNIAPLRVALNSLPHIEDVNVELMDTIKIESTSISEDDKKKILDTALLMKPWRKGPFNLFGIEIDSEWRSYEKYNILKPYLDLEEKRVADVGCNNGYYMFRMLEFSPLSILGVDPSPLFFTQFEMINNFINSDKIRYEMLGIEHMKWFEEKFDTIFCLGVLYHRSDPVSSLKSLKVALKRGGELILDTFFIDSDDSICLVPKSTYSKIPNIYFIPSVLALESWCDRAGFHKFEVLYKSKTTTHEQRKTEWIYGESLENFLDPSNSELTIEGYPAPKRVYIRAYRK